MIHQLSWPWIIYARNKTVLNCKNPNIAYSANPQMVRSCPYARSALWQGKVALQCLLIDAGWMLTVCKW